MQGSWELAEGCTYTLTADDVNRLGIPITAPLDTVLCGFCDSPVDAEGRCHSCRTIHLDARLTDIEHLGPGRIAA